MGQRDVKQRHGSRRKTGNARRDVHEKGTSDNRGVRPEYYQESELHYPFIPWHTSCAQKPHHAACQRAASPAALIALGIVASLTLLCNEQDHWRQISKSSKGARKEDPDLRASAIKRGFEIEDAMTRRGERPDADRLLALSPDCSNQLLFSILFVCADTTWQKFFPIEFQRKASRLGTKNRTGEPLLVA